MTSPNTEPRASDPKGSSLVAFVTEHWEQLVAIVTGGGYVLYGLGFFVQRSREQLLNLAIPLDYPFFFLVTRSLEVVAKAVLAMLSLPWWRNGFLIGIGLAMAIASAIFAWKRPEQSATPRWLRTARGTALVMATLLLVLGWPALDPPLADQGQGPDLRLTGLTLPQLYVTSWLQGDQRSELLGLFGLVAWAVAFAAVTLTSLWRDREAPLRLPQLVLGLALVVGLLFTLPRAYVLGQHGLRYPVAELRADESCDPELRAALATKTCCAFEITDGATDRWLLFRGDGCPEGRGAFHNFGDDSNRCIGLNGPRGVFVGCG